MYVAGGAVTGVNNGVGTGTVETMVCWGVPIAVGTIVAVGTAVGTGVPTGVFPTQPEKISNRVTNTIRNNLIFPTLSP